MSLSVPLMLLALAGAVVLSTPQARSTCATTQRVRDGPRKRLRAALRPHMEAIAGADDLDVFAACLTSGLSPHQAAHCLGRHGRLSQWGTVAALLDMGVAPDTAWGEFTQVPGLEELVALARNSHRSGAGFARSCADLAGTLRERGQHQAAAAAARAGVLIALPLTFCFLPAFLLIGLLPILVELGIGIIH